MSACLPSCRPVLSPQSICCPPFMASCCQDSECECLSTALKAPLSPRSFFLSCLTALPPACLHTVPSEEMEWKEGPRQPLVQILAPL